MEKKLLVFIGVPTLKKLLVLVTGAVVVFAFVAACFARFSAGGDTEGLRLWAAEARGDGRLLPPTGPNKLPRLLVATTAFSLRDMSVLCVCLRAGCGSRRLRGKNEPLE
jgi:hypothetical protein